MSRLTVYDEARPDDVLLRTDDPDRIASELRAIGVTFERWHAPVAVGRDDAAERVLDAYRPYLDRLIGASGAGSADVIRLRPDAPNYAPLRSKFLSEHTHTEDEVRFFVDGGGSFVLHVDGRVHDAHCTAGDLIAVPADIRHWFDAGERPDFTALRIFTDTSGWVPHYTGDPISERFPVA